MSDYYILITDAGAALEAAAHAAGEKVELAEFGVCDGGVEFIPDPAATTFPNEVYRNAISSLKISETDPTVFIAQCIIPATSGGYTVRGVALYASDGTLYATGNYANQDKPAPDSGFAVSLEILAELAVSDTSDITLVVSDTAYLTEAQADTLYLRQDKQLGEIKADGATAQQAARDNLDLKSAATHDVTTSRTDTTAGHVLQVGDYGWGVGNGTTISLASIYDIKCSGVYNALGKGSSDPAEGMPDDSGNTRYAVLAANVYSNQYWVTLISNNEFYVGNVDVSAKTALWRRFYNTNYKPTAEDVNAVAKAGDTMTGKLTMNIDGEAIRLHPKTAGAASYILSADSTNANSWYIGTGSADNADTVFNNYKGSNNSVILKADGSVTVNPTGGKSAIVNGPIELLSGAPQIIFHESDTGKKYILVSDGNNIRLDEDSTAGNNVWTWTSSTNVLSVNGELIPSNYGNFDARYYTQTAANAKFVQGVQFGAQSSHNVSNGASFSTAGYALSGFYCDGNNDDLDTLYAKPMQENVNGTWKTLAG